MKAIVELTQEEFDASTATYKALCEATKGVRHSDLFENYTRRSGYAHYDFSGTVTDKLVELLGREPTSSEIIMLIDSGFSHFGASCSLLDRKFRGSVNTD